MDDLEDIFFVVVVDPALLAQHSVQGIVDLIRYDPEVFKAAQAK